ncbi:heme oxygenase (biliverdin-producing) [Streptomyces anandii]|uniref:heme oxygenase (biliverdin-producing) n=1 Tax=Streptomyces anandii TaxID=285454 RepID=UPI0037A122AE
MDSFSDVLRTATREQHRAAESAPFMSALLGARLEVAAFARYTEQLWFVYEALERDAARLARDPVAGPFVRPELLRLPALAEDLAHLRGPAWRSTLTALPATLRYAARIGECARAWPAGYVAHHYTRYLGDLSGGRVVRDRAERAWGFAPGGPGVRFYDFDRLADPVAFRHEYRRLLDGLGAESNAAERRRVADECGRAFALNTGVLEDLYAELRVST